MRRYGIWAVRSAASRLGPDESWLKKGGVRQEFDTLEEAQAEAARVKADMLSPNLNYFGKEIT